ncbi:helicase-like protein [Tanacetum coccineum]
MTCNPNWPEIQRHVEDAIPGQPTCDRPDVIVKVFKIKLDELMKDIRKSNLFGRVKVGAFIYTIEFQKRGLPHCHALIFLHEDDKIFSLDQIDYVISAELPSEVDDQIGFEATIIKTKNIICFYSARENEIKEYLNCRYILASEACWKIYGFEMNNRSIAVERLPFHEKGCNRVYFREDDDAEDVVDRATSAMSKSWEEICTVDGIEYPTYRATCKAYRLLGDDVEWVQAITDASQWQECVPFLSQDIPYRQQQLLQNDQVVFTNEEI